MELPFVQLASASEEYNENTRVLCPSQFPCAESRCSDPI